MFVSDCGWKHHFMKIYSRVVFLIQVETVPEAASGRTEHVFSWPVHLCTCQSSRPSISPVNLPLSQSQSACRSFLSACPLSDYITRKCQKCNLLHHPCSAETKMAEPWEPAPRHPTPPFVLGFVILCHSDAVKITPGISNGSTIHSLSARWSGCDLVAFSSGTERQLDRPAEQLYCKV